MHNNPSLLPVQKFTYLHSLVSKSAKEAIAGLALTDANYSEAVKLLEIRFGNKERIIAKHMDALLNLESVASNTNTGALRALYDKIEAHTRELKALGVAAEAYNCLLPSLLMKKLPNELCLTISRRVPEDEWKLDRIMSELSDELKAREHTLPKSESGRGKEHKEHSSEHGYRRSRERPTSATLHTSVGTCCYCGSEHTPESCTKVDKPENRKSVLRDSGRCFICLKRGHLSRNCRSSIKCRQCSSKHHVSICTKKPDSVEVSQLDPNATPFRSASLLTDSNGTILLQTAQATVRNRANALLRLIFDSGSQRSYITQRARRKLSLRALGRKELVISTFGNGSRKQSCEVVKATLETREERDLELTLLVIPLICEPITSMALKDGIQGYDHLRDLDLEDSIGNGEVVNFDILIGLDHYWNVVSGEVVRGSNGPTAVYSKLGWLLSGPVESSSTTLVTHVLTSGVKVGQQKVELNEQLRRFWELESFGIEEKESTLYDQFKTNVSFDGTRYQVVLPWRDHVTTIPDNYELSLRRLKGLLRRLRQNPTLLEDYNKAIVSQLENGIVEIVSDLTSSDGERVHYLPHHAVIKQDKQTTKLRVVYDASAKSTGPSLNECLHIGPKFNQRIFEILVRFRLHASAFIADIEKAFLMISVDKRDRDVLRFLWVKDIHKDPPEIQVLRFTRVTFGVASSPFLLNATVRNHIEQFQESNPVAVDKLLRSIYVDDVVSGTAEEGKSVQLYEEFRIMLAQGGFYLRKFVRSASSEHESRGELQQVLGVAWNPVQDYMIMDLRNIAAEANLCNPTKRHIVSIASKVYDPIGIVSPVTVKFKMLLQDLHCAKIDWDQKISKHLLDYWSELIMSIKDSEPVLIPRSYFKPLSIESNVQWRLHGFSDASTRAYAAVVYLERCTGEDREVSFVSSKTRIAPTSAQTIPRLELLGALLLA